MMPIGRYPILCRRPAIGLLGLLILGVLASCVAGAPTAPRNLLVICLDTVRHDSFFADGIDDRLTPWLNHAQVYANATSTAPWTIPAVASLVTGRYQIEHGAGQFENAAANLDTDLPSVLQDDIDTLAEHLTARYFRTGAFVSHPFFKAGLGLDQGFQVVHNRRGWWRDTAAFWKWANRIKPPTRFFGYLHFMEAHHRHTRPNDELHAFVDELDAAAVAALTQTINSRPANNCRKASARRCLQNLVYEASVRELRNGVASILDELKEKNLLNETLVVVYSDHGEEFWDHEAIQLVDKQDPRKHTGLGHGQSLFQELLHVPLLVWVPGQPGKVHEENVSLVDVVPSLIAWLGLAEAHVDPQATTGVGAFETPPGVRTLPPLSSPGLWQRIWGREDRRVYASGIAYGPEQIATRQGPLKSIAHLRNDTMQLYRLDSDPAELAPLGNGDHGGLLLEFDTLTGDYLDMAALYGEASTHELNSEQLDSLKAIGYLQGVEEEGEDTTGQTPSGDQEKD